MNINELNAGEYTPLKLTTAIDENDPDVNKNEKFTDTLKELVSDVNSMQKDSAEMTEKFIKGEPVDLHDVMIASEKAKTGFELLLQLRNKFTDMYREINRLQV